ncbi:cell division protein FtsA [bacterium]|nr:MAG: cell division protein FtsA [bacterium]
MQEIYTSVDIGTHSVKVVIAEERIGGEITVKGIGEAVSKGVARGNIMNIEKAEKPLLVALADAEKMADTEAREVFLTLGGDQLRTIASRGITAIPKDKEAIDSTNVSDVLQAAHAVVISSEAVIVDSVVREFIVDGQGGNMDPIGMTGVRMEADVGLLITPKSTLSNLERVVERAGLIPDGQAASIRASGLAVLTPDEAEIGVAVVDIGCGTTDVGVFRRGTLVWAFSVGYAGESVTKDLTVGLSLPFDSAEQLKLEFGTALEESVDASEMVTIPGIGGRESRSVARRFLGHIIEPRLEEILIMCKDGLFESDFLGKLPAGVVLTGGSSQTENIVHLAESVFNLPVRTGAPSLPGDVPEIARSLRFATAIGGILAASERHHRADLIDETSSLWSKIRRWFLRKV